MKVGLIYRGEFVNQETNRPDNENIQQVGRLDILDMDTLIEDDQDEEIVTINNADVPVVISVIDNDEDPLTPVRAKQLETQIYSGEGISISTFADGGDKRYKVRYYLNSILKFEGWLSISDLVQDFMPDPNVISLTAVDGLGFLQDIPLTDFDGNNPRFEQPLMQYLAWILAGTGHQLNIVCCANIREAEAPSLNADATGDGHFFKWNWMHAKSLEDEISTSVNSLDALKGILKEEMTCYQDDATWFIMRKDEYIIDRSYFLFTFDYLGNFVSKSTENFTKSVGVDLPLSWMNDDAAVGLVRPLEEVRLNYKYETPKEIIDNIDFERGDLILDSGDTKTYTLDDWKKVTVHNTTGVEQPTEGFEAYIQKEYDEQGDVIEQYAVLTAGTFSGSERYWIRSRRIPMREKDKFNFSQDWRLETDVSSSGERTVYLAMFVLHGNDGSKWIYTNSAEGFPISFFDLRWIPYDDATFYHSIYYVYTPDEVDETSPITVSSEVKPLPVDGELVIYLANYKQNSDFGWTHDMRISNLQLEYLPYINGSYKRYTGQYHKVTSAHERSVGKREEEVYLSDSPKPLFKGALLKVSGTEVLHNGSTQFAAPNSFVVDGNQTLLYDKGMKIIITGTNAGVYNVTDVIYHLFPDNTEIQVAGTITTVTETATISRYLFTLANRFYNAQVFPDADYPDDSYVHPYGHLQVFDVYNQFNRLMRVFDGTIDGLESDGEMPDLKHKYFLTDPDSNTTSKMFMAIHYEQEQHLCEMKGRFHEVQDSTIPNEYSGNEFKYTTK